MTQISRRSFLATTATAGAAVFASGLLPEKAHALPMGLPAGIQLYTVRQPMQTDVPGTLKKLHEIGYREVETAGFGKYTAKEFRGLLDDAGLKVPSAHLQLNGDLEKAFADAHTLGATYAISSMLRAPTEAPTNGPDHFKRLAELMNELGQKAKVAGLQYGYHNHNVEFEKMPDGSYGYDILVNQTDHELVKFEIDCGWMVVAGGDPVAYMKKYPGRFRMLHIKDFKKPDTPVTHLGNGPGHAEGVELGQGFIQYGPIFAAGRAAGIQHSFNEQEEPYAHSPLDSAKIDYDFIAKFK